MFMLGGLIGGIKVVTEVLIMEVPWSVKASSRIALLFLSATKTYVREEAPPVLALGAASP